MALKDVMLIEFSVQDRCDRCGAQAYMLAEHEDFGELLFCLHHARENRRQLRDEGWRVTLDTEGLSVISSDYPAPV